MSLTIDGVTQYIGMFGTEREAALAYDAYVIKGKVLRHLNLPDATPAAKRHKPPPFSSRYNGVFWRKDTKKWVCQLSIPKTSSLSTKKTIHIGTFADEREAAHAWDEAVRENKLGKHLNFPGDDAAPGAPLVLRSPSGKSGHIRKKASRYFGVDWDKTKRTWIVGLPNKGGWLAKAALIGSGHVDEIDAARAYDAYVIKKKLPRHLNFPERTQKAQRHTRGKAPSHLSRYFGVYWIKSRTMWRAQLAIGSACIHVGNFADETDAARAWDAAVRKRRLDKYLNFPESSMAVAEIDGNASQCTKCSRGGDLVCCDGCPNAYHVQCVSAFKRNRVPEGDWFCPSCVAINSTAARGGSGGGRRKRKKNESLKKKKQQQQQQQQQKKDKTIMSSRYRGLCWNKKENKWQALCTVNRNTVSLGRFWSEKDAARAYDAYLIKKKVPRHLNFPKASLAAQKHTADMVGEQNEFLPSSFLPSSFFYRCFLLTYNSNIYTT